MLGWSAEGAASQDMESLVEMLRALTAVLFVGLAATALVLWRRRRDAPAKWAAVSFALLAGVTTVGLVVPDTGGEAVQWARKVRIATLLCVPYCLHRFAAAFTGVSKRVERVAAAATLLLVAATLVLPPLRRAGEPAAAWSGWYLATALTVWTALSALVAVKLWVSGRAQASVVRRRMRLLASASVGLSVAILTAGFTRGVSTEWPSLVVQGLAVVSTALVWAGLTPPRFLLASWRRPDEAHLDQAVQSLVAATSRDQITGVLLPHLVRVVGGRGAALIDDEQRVLATSGDVRLSDASDGVTRKGNAAATTSSQRIDFALRSGQLSLWVSPYTPFFGQDELHRVRSLASLLDLAWERICLAELEREAQQALLHERDFSQRLLEAERERDRFAGHVQLLGRVSESLMQSLDLSESLSRLARALVPSIADWVSIQVRAEHDQLYDIAIHHRDPRLAAVTREAEEHKRRRNCFTEPSRRAAGGRSVLLPLVDSNGLVQQVPDAELRSLVQQLGMHSALAVPIPGRTGVVGSILLANASGSGGFGESDLTLAAEIGRRAGIALDNVRLHAEQRHVATELQQSLLTAPPVLPLADIAVRYVAAAQEAQVGGDWYDAFCHPSGDLMLVIGDVVGHDTRAAAAMGQLRALVRGISFTTAEKPSKVLTSVDEAMEGLELATIATAVLAQLTPSRAPGSTSTIGLRVRWSNAGHPPPVLLDRRGHARVLGPSTGKADLLLGVNAPTRRHTQQATLPAGSTLLLYTDGLVERRWETLDDGLSRLLSTIEQHAHEDLDAFCDAILSKMLPDANDDDVAILAVRPKQSPPGRVADVGSPLRS
ncbi:GAF domain-containing SpoIIE family protein phosphatase [Geodermatophilus sp. DSM 44513]|uniref:PP2C family protein-serine/threonine phosphatase n=1 Tax=Geodermatophilus sp. DSM 44513 TaxID=1528104 RepID=UPI001270CBB8|nr:GAF domain-containing SpoIIE family protein phosphatase [Geodermatophilus sp. DSM 44513]WNV76843.1 SpoIIE family protein phosphatase [Geodermatophilus sp. DSM 44513]